jgi:hypothetical protein
MKTTANLGDTVSGIYCGVSFTGILHSYSARGAMSVTFPAPFTPPVVFGVVRRDGIYIEVGHQGSVRTIARPVTAPAVRAHDDRILSGVCLA